MYWGIICQANNPHSSVGWLPDTRIFLYTERSDAIKYGLESECLGKHTLVPSDRISTIFPYIEETSYDTEQDANGQPSKDTERASVS